MKTSDTHNKLFVPLHKETAAADLQPVLEHIEKVLGFIPNLIGTIANAPAVAKGYHSLFLEFTKTSLTRQEQQLVLLAVSVENNGRYCTIAHSTTARSLAHVPADIINAVRHNEPLADAKLNALITLTRELVRHRGHAGIDVVRAFIDAGYRKEQILEILLGIALKTVSNYLDHLSPIEIDAPFQTGQAA